MAVGINTFVTQNSFIMQTSRVAIAISLNVKSCSIWNAVVFTRFESSLLDLRMLRAFEGSLDDSNLLSLVNECNKCMKHEHVTGFKVEIT